MPVASYNVGTYARVHEAAAMPERGVDILLVEDNEHDEELTLYALRRSKVANAFHVARDGADALDFLGRRGIYAERDSTLPKLILLDLHLPKVSGADVLAHIKNDPVTRDIPVVVLISSHADREILDLPGVGGYIIKPVTFEQLSNVVRQVGLYHLLVG